MAHQLLPVHHSFWLALRPLEVHAPLEHWPRIIVRGWRLGPLHRRLKAPFGQLRRLRFKWRLPTNAWPLQPRHCFLPKEWQLLARALQ